MEEVKELLGKGAITEVQNPQGRFYSNIYLVPKKDGGQRPVINLKALNSFVHTEHFKMEGIHTLRDLVNLEDWLAKVDFKDIYFVIPIHNIYHQYLRFYYQNICYQFQFLPFGLSLAPWVFTKTLKPALALLREMGVRLIAYIDNIHIDNTHMINLNGKSLLKKEVDMTIDSDASLMGWGANQSEPEDRRSMVTSKEQYAHQLPGVAGSNIGSEDIPEKQNQDVSAPQVGQYHSSGIHKQPGRDSLQGIGRLSKGIMDVVPGEEHPHHSPAPTRCSECDSRCGVSDYDRHVRLAAKPSHIRQDCRPVWSSGSGPVCLTPDRTMPSLFQLVARSLCSGNRCFSAGLVSDQGVCQPPVEPDRPSSVQGTDGKGTDCASGTCLEDTAMASTATANVNCSSTSDLSQTGDAVQRSGGSRPSASCVAYLRERYRDQELSEEAASLMLKSWCTKKNKSYDSLFGKWHSCSVCVLIACSPEGSGEIF